MSLEDFAFISEDFVSSSLESTVWEYLVLRRVQFVINCTALVQSESSNFVECTIRY